MNRAEVKQTLDFLLECHEALREEDGTEAMMLCLHRLYQVIRRLTSAVPETSDKDLRFLLRTMAKKARKLRRQIEGRLGVRN